jgi:hypothetical protein
MLITTDQSINARVSLREGLFTRLMRNGGHPKTEINVLVPYDAHFGNVGPVETVRF